MKNILWTGSNGFIAGYAIQKLLDEDYKIWGIDNYWKYGIVSKSYDNHPNFKFIEADAKNDKLLLDIIINNKINILVSGAAIIGGITMFHELAYDLIAENDKLTCAAFDAAIKAYQQTNFFEKIVVISSSMVYENVNSYPSKENDIEKFPPPSSTYGFQKLAVEYFAKGAYEQYKLPYTIIRPFNAIGIGEKRAKVEKDCYSGNIKMAMSHVLPDLVQKIYKGQNPLHILGNGNQIRHYTYAGDLANGIYECIINPNALNNVFNISTNKGHTVLELAKIIWNRLNPDKEFNYICDEPYKWDVQKRVPDVSKAEKILNIKCETTLEEALDEIIPWIIEQIKIGGI